MAERIRLVVVDDHAIVRQGLRSILEREPDIRVVGEAATPGEALDLVVRERPHIVLLDLKLSAGSDVEGLALCGELTGGPSSPGVLVVTTFLDQQLVLRAIQAGARGYVLKDVDATALVAAIRAVRRGESAFDSHSAAAVVASLAAPATGPDGTDLTAREREVLALLARGLSNEAIGRELYISATTAKFHVGNVLRKLSVSRRAEAVYAGSKLGLI
ncbi:MadR family response regulator transcription factor [Klenkia taihuensis]|uniref:Two component transcriptional regulator, LuxR family n=1 Tax=Klenkia taihuensis TaxID=1225127 RepID=A0A1I1R8H5_9ACTN|nr:response regulator transcription factor [Klenkia taihuensis]GHE07140.1 DNA-binding response regulator [Klenkia taihuensis]SFD30552.1 two component transcriptional regulator, LuxR family [Klenkia taihuensis]